MAHTVDGSEIPPTTERMSFEPVVNNGIFTISTGAGFLPSTGCPVCSDRNDWIDHFVTARRGSIRICCPLILLVPL